MTMFSETNGGTILLYLIIFVLSNLIYLDLQLINIQIL